MEREEAIEAIKAKMDYYESDKRLRAALETLIPELCESEDERIRKFLVDYFTSYKIGNVTTKLNGYRIDDIIAYLEKQKEEEGYEAIPIESTLEYKIGFKAGRDFEKQKESLHISETCKEDDNSFTNEDEVHRKWILEYLYDGLRKSDEQFKGQFKSAIDWFEKQKEQKPAEWKPQPESLEALMYAIEGKWEMIKPTSYLSRRLEDLYDGLVNTYNVNETFLAELPKTAYTAEDIEELKVLKDKIDASMDEKPAEWTECEFPQDIEKDAVQFCFDIGLNVTPYQAKQIASHYLIIGHNEGYIEGRKNAHILAKELGLPSSMDYKQEWSEEDERIKSCICLALTDVNEQRFKDFGTTLKDCLAWVKDLHPSWKPSEEQN